MGEQAEIVSIETNRKIKIRWLDAVGCEMYTSTHQLRKGSFKNPYRPSVYGRGYQGYGLYSPENNVKAHIAWQGMHQRCYDEEVHRKFPSYAKHFVSEDWHNFQNFAEWFEEESSLIPENEVWHLDKDLLRGVGYSKETCVLLPKSINILLVKNDTRRGSTLIGVSFEQAKGKYRARCQNGTGSAKHLGYFEKEIDAYFAYKAYKEAYIKSLADRYKTSLSQRAYEALINYEVQITD